MYLILHDDLWSLPILYKSFLINKAKLTNSSLFEKSKN